MSSIWLIGGLLWFSSLTAIAQEIVHLPKNTGWQYPHCYRHSCAIYPLKSFLIGSTKPAHRGRYSPKLSVEMNNSGSVFVALMKNVPSTMCSYNGKNCFFTLRSGSTKIQIAVRTASTGTEIVDVGNLVKFVEANAVFSVEYVSDRKDLVKLEFPSKDVGNAPFTGRY